jgi:hypothetical protein
LRLLAAKSLFLCLVRLLQAAALLRKIKRWHPSARENIQAPEKSETRSPEIRMKPEVRGQDCDRQSPSCSVEIYFCDFCAFSRLNRFFFVLCGFLLVQGIWCFCSGSF